MAQVLHIDGLGNEPLGAIYIEPGTTLRDLVHRFGGTIRVEYVPDKPRPPRKVPADVAEFVRTYQAEEPGSVLAVVRRYGWLDAEEFDTVDEAESYIESGEDWGSHAGEAVVRGEEVRPWR